MFVKKLSEFISFTENPITIPLEDDGEWRRDGARAGIRMDPSGDEETCEEDEKS